MSTILSDKNWKHGQFGAFNLWHGLTRTLWAATGRTQLRAELEPILYAGSMSFRACFAHPSEYSSEECEMEHVS